MSKPELSEKAFWQYSFNCYTHSDTAMHALSLQDNHGVNVNMLMLLCWCLDNRVIVDLAQFEALKAAADEMEPTLNERRKERRAAHPNNGGSEQEYQKKKNTELDIERLQQRKMLKTFNQLELTRLPETAGAGILNASVAAFIHCYCLRDDSTARQHVRTIINQLPR